MKSFSIIFLILAALPAAGADLCQGLALDKGLHPMKALAKPALGVGVKDPAFGATVRRITAVAASGANPAVVPLYSTVSAWNADESRLLLYRVGKGHELYDGRSYRFLRALDIDPVEIEQVYWHTTDPDLLFYVSGHRLVRYHVRTGLKDTVHDFTFCAGPLGGGPDPMFTSWDSNVIGLKCGAQAFLYRISTNTLTGSATTTLPAPQAAASGTRGFMAGYVVDLGLKIQRRLDLANPYEHASLGRTAAGGDAFHAVAFDAGPLGSDVGSLVTHDLATGTSKVVVGPATGYPYPPTGTHVSALAYRQPGWVFLSILGDPAGQGVLDNELVIADTANNRVCRAAHHRSWGSLNTKLADPYWAEPHVVPSPSGTRAIFASDWGNGATVDTFVAELPSYRKLGLALSTNKTQFVKGQTLTVGLGLQNPGLPTRVDLILLAVKPDGQSLVSYTPTGAVAGVVSTPAAWPALSPGLNLTTAFDYNQPGYLTITWKGSEPPGAYRFILLAVEPGARADGQVNDGDLWASASVTVTFQP